MVGVEAWAALGSAGREYEWRDEGECCEKLPWRIDRGLTAECGVGRGD
jgi:hypothetical protein